MAAKSSNSDTDNETFSEINVTPFVDVVLVLLVVFMVTAPILVKNSIKVQLPKATQRSSAAPKTLALSVTKQGQMIFEGQLLAQSAILTRLQEEVAKDPKIQLAIAADAESLHQNLVDAIDVAKQAGVENFALEVQKPK